MKKTKSKSESRRLAVQKKAKKVNKKKRYGMNLIPKGTKACWMSEQNKNGWSLGFALESHTIWLRNTRFATKAQVEQAVGAKNVVFMPLKGSK